MKTTLVMIEVRLYSVSRVAQDSPHAAGERAKLGSESDEPLPRLVVHEHESVHVAAHPRAPEQRRRDATDDRAARAGPVEPGDERPQRGAQRHEAGAIRHA
jgi:hypothetical protein